MKKLLSSMGSLLVLAMSIPWTAQAAATSESTMGAGLSAATVQTVETTKQPYAATPEAIAEMAAKKIKADVNNIVLFADDRVLQGVSNREDYYFEIGKSRKLLPGSYIELIYGHSQTLIASRSTLTILLDDVPLGSVFLNEKNREGAKWRMDISSFPFDPGFHKLSIVTHMEVTNDLCTDQDNTANWMRISSDSIIHLNTTSSYASPDLSYYPSPFLEKGSTKPLNAAFVLPDTASNADLTALTRLSQYFASTVAAINLDMDVYRESDVSNKLLGEQPLIWIGAAQEWTQSGAQVLAQLRKEQPNGAEANRIALVASPANSDITNLFIMADESAMANAVTMLTDETLIGQLYGKSVSIPETITSLDQSANAETSSKTQQVTFADMGYGNLTVESLMVGAARISYPIPSEWELKSGVKLNLKYKHSKALNFAQSMIAVKVNGIPVASKFLSAESSEAGVLNLELSKDLFTSQRSIDIDVGFQFSANVSEAACSASSSHIGNWAVIDSSSSLSYVYKKRNTTELQNLPSPLATKGDWSESAILVPKDASASELSALATFMGMIGRNETSGLGLQVLALDGSAWEQAAADKQLLVVGSADKLPQKLLACPEGAVTIKDGQLTPTAAQVELLGSIRERAAWLQLCQSPLNEDRAMVMVAATDEGAIGLVNAAMVAPATNAKIAGRLAVIDERKEVHPFLVSQQAADQSSSASELLTTANKTVADRLLMIGGIAIVMIAAAVLFWWIRRRRGSL
ncbi:cellulose biosynthesis cyclic di-GMP-binding regulatory protein BcsB [Paenibacillus xanthanilyticus]|uniref:Cellulose biosynthesis cyclic di-GMP-binding regulatory protein BcsB n=1 Tax=Paenibacillus xanthanilyticus TaxID=1783531 RepID=A0ABV8K0C4_9BACL